VAKTKTDRQLCLDLRSGVSKIEEEHLRTAMRQVSCTVVLEDVRNERYRKILLETLRASGLLALKEPC
jgi:hypothetical protein